jgi:hypothetical protein
MGGIINAIQAKTPHEIGDYSSYRVKKEEDLKSLGFRLSFGIDD